MEFRDLDEQTRVLMLKELNKEFSLSYHIYISKKLMQKHRLNSNRGQFFHYKGV